MNTGVKNLQAYQLSYELAMKVFEKTKKFPVEEKYSLTDQIRRSSRSVSANIAEAYSKRRYRAHFISKLTDADMENSETQVWLNLALDCVYLTEKDFEELSDLCTRINKLLNYMIMNPQKFSPKTNHPDT